MKAHRREAKNCALIECAQVAAEKAKWPIRDEFKRMSSLTGGGGERARIPNTVTDENGRIGERRRGPAQRPQPAPQPVHAGQTASPSSTPPSPAPVRPAATRFSSLFGTRRR